MIVCLPTQETRAPSLTWEIPHARKQLSLSPTTAEPALQRPGAAMTKAPVPWSLRSTREATATSEQLVRCNEGQPLQPEKGLRTSGNPAKLKRKK